MKMKKEFPPFLPGMDLNRQFYAEVVRPLMEEHFPDLQYAAALTGNGSDVLRFDSETSIDHNWGPRMQLFLKKSDFDEFAPKIDKMLRTKLPYTFKGFPTNFTEEDPDSYLKQEMVFIDKGEVNHYIQLFTIQSFLKHYLGFDRDNEITIQDWLTFPQQALVEVTAGEVFHDGYGELTALREKLAYFPKDVWLYALRVQWGRIAIQVAFGARTGEQGDEVGSRFIAAKHIEEIMRMVFLLERQYSPYIKWFGTAFKRNLRHSGQFLPLFDRIFNSTDWHERQALLCECWQILGHMHNELGITPPQSTELVDFPGRGYPVFECTPYIKATEEAIADPEIKNMRYMLGQIDQFIDHSRLNLEDYVYRQMKMIIK